MTFVTKSASMAALMTIVIFAPGLARAQEPPRLRASFAPAVATVSGDAELALGGTFGYRFSEHFWFEGDFTWIDAAAGGFSDRPFDIDGRDFGVGMAGLPNLITPGSGTSFRWAGGGIGVPGMPNLPNFPNFPNLPGFPGGLDRLRASTGGSTMVGTLGIRYDLPAQTDRFRPYLAGGLGINNTEQEFRLDSTAFTPAIEESTSHTGYAFSAGAGASIRLVSQLWADVDAKYFRLSRERNIMRLGGGVSVRF
jgi:opacity protein-like surface antigen